MRSTTFSGLALAAFSLFASSAAFAARPPECFSGSGAEGYQAGLNLERNLLTNIWNTRYDCNTLEDFILAVDIPFPVTSWPSPYLMCRDAGIVDAITGVMGEKTAECHEQCSASGAGIGVQQGKLYCSIKSTSPTAVGIRLCTAVSTQSCQASLRSTVNQMCASKAASDPSFNQYVNLACSF